MSTSHHSSIVAQYHHSRTKLYILAMDLIASTAAAAPTTTPTDTVDNGFDSAAVASDTDECEFGSLFVVSVRVDATIVAVVPVVVVIVVVSSIKNKCTAAFIPPMHIINFYIHFRLVFIVCRKNIAKLMLVVLRSAQQINRISICGVMRMNKSSCCNSIPFFFHLMCSDRIC